MRASFYRASSSKIINKEISTGANNDIAGSLLIYLNLNDPNIKVYEEMPELDLSEELEKAVKNVMKNEFVKKARIFDTKDGSLNTLNLLILLENFNELSIINGLNKIGVELDKPFYTLSYIIKLIKSYQNED